MGSFISSIDTIDIRCTAKLYVTRTLTHMVHKHNLAFRKVIKKKKPTAAYLLGVFD